MKRLRCCCPWMEALCFEAHSITQRLHTRVGDNISFKDMKRLRCCCPWMDALCFEAHTGPDLRLHGPKCMCQHHRDERKHALDRQLPVNNDVRTLKIFVYIHDYFDNLVQRCNNITNTMLDLDYFSNIVTALFTQYSHASFMVIITTL